MQTIQVRAFIDKGRFSAGHQMLPMKLQSMAVRYDKVEFADMQVNAKIPHIYCNTHAQIGNRVWRTLWTSRMQQQTARLII